VRLAPAAAPAAELHVRGSGPRGGGAVMPPARARVRRGRQCSSSRSGRPSARSRPSALPPTACCYTSRTWGFQPPAQPHPELRRRVPSTPGSCCTSLRYDRAPLLLAPRGRACRRSARLRGLTPPFALGADARRARGGARSWTKRRPAGRRPRPARLPRSGRRSAPRPRPRARLSQRVPRIIRKICRLGPIMGPLGLVST